MSINKISFAVLAASSLFAVSTAFAAQSNQQGEGSAIVTILPAAEIPSGVSQQALHLKINGKNATITGWKPLRSPASNAEVVVLIDSGARTNLASQFSEIVQFIKQLPADAKVAVAYMENGRAVFTSQMSADHATMARTLHLPLSGMPGISASPYFCLSDLAKNWPSTDAHARREVVMITSGVDYYEQRYNPDDPYLQTAIDDAIRARIVVYSIYWRGQGRFENTAYATDSGQNLLSQLSDTTGGYNYWQGYGDPVNIGPYLADINHRLDNQYELDFMTPLTGKPQMESLRLKVSVHAKVDVQQRVYVHAVAVQ